jgi:hypothetical protein
VAGPADSPESAGLRLARVLARVLARRTVIAVAVIVILSVPFAVFAAISGQVTAASWAALGGAVALTNLMIGGQAIAYSVFITPTVVLFTSTSIADVANTDRQRLTFTLIGSALVLLASGITLVWTRYQLAHPSAATGP